MGPMPTDDSDALDTIVVELYALPPSEFTTARTDRGRHADAALAGRIAKIRKPVVSAWVVDLLAREGHLVDALELGEALRAAQDDLDAAELARLGRQRRQLVAALARTGVELAGGRGVAVSAAAQQDVEATLNAALIDARAASAVASARLAKPLDAAGDLDPADALSGSTPAPAAPPPPDDELAERRARRGAERAARDAERDAERAERDRAQASTARERAQERAQRLQERVEELRRELDRVTRESDAAAAALEEADRLARAAAAAAHSAARRAEAARSALSARG